MTPKIIAMLVAIVLIIVIGMVLVVKRSAERRAARSVATVDHPGLGRGPIHSISRCFIA